MKLPSALLMLCTSFSLAQSPPPNAPGSPPPPPGGNQPFTPQPGGPPQGPNGPGQGGSDKRSNRPFVDMMRQRYEGKDKDKGGGGSAMDQLNEEDRKRLRTVMEKVWNSDEVKTARDAAADAAKKYRDVMHEAALKADPSLAPVLEKIKANMERMPMNGGFPQGQPGGQPGQPGQPGQGNAPGPQGPPNGPAVPNANPNPNPGGAPRGDGANGRPMNRGDVRGDANSFRPFGIEAADYQKLPEAQRERLRGAFEKIMQNPDVKAAREATESAEGEGKRDAFRKMREAIKTVAEKEFPDLAKLVETLRSQSGAGRGPAEGRRPGRPEAEGAAPPPPPATGQAPPADSPGAPENAPPK